MKERQIKAPRVQSRAIRNLITRMTLITRIYTDNKIRAYPCYPRNPCSITDFGKIIHRKGSKKRKVSQQEFLCFIINEVRI